ncbi:MAG: FecR domain-containing protein [Niastella sp.]|nr:FecR domain-containing protein [Niastella sp.]
MKNLPHNLVLIFYKRKAGTRLTRAEKRAWKKYRKVHPREETFDDNAFEELARYQQEMPPVEEFFQRYAIPLTSPFPTQQKQEATGRVLRFPRRHLAVAASILFIVACAAWWFFLRDNVHWSRLQTAKGEQRQFTLPDNTKIWLNAATVLSYPQTFGNGPREVILEEGEAYFEVTKKGEEQPFIVRCKDQQITVLGTQFNIKAYAADATVTTTLVEGKVHVQQGQQSMVLMPGQQAVTGKQGNLSLSAAHPKEATGWKNKFFTFYNKRLSGIMAEVQRWYDVELIYVDPLNDSLFTIDEFPRSEPVKGLLENLEASGLVQFDVKGRKIYIRKGIP